MPKDTSENCTAIARLIKDFCSCSENGAWSPDMTSDKRKGPFLKSELTNMSAMRRRIISIAKRKHRELIPEPPKLYDEKKSETLTSNLINTTLSSQNSTLRRNIDSFLQSRRMFALEEDIYEKPIQPYSNSLCGENWSLSKAWKISNADFYNSPSPDSNKLLDRNYSYLERIDEVPKKKREKRYKEQLRYDRNIKRHIRIRVMLSLRMRRYMKRRLRKPYLNMNTQNVNVPPRRFPRGSSVTSSFGTRSYRSVMRDKLGDGAVLFDVHEARNSTMELCHDYEEDLDTLDIALRAGNFRSGRLAVEGWCCARGMPAQGGRANNGALALHYAAARGCLDCVRLLANTTPDVSANTAMDNDVTPVYLAAQEGHLAVLKYLVLEAGGRLDARARDGMLPIHAAAQTGCLDCVKWMIVERGVDPNARDGDGATPLHFAASRGHLTTVRWLLRHGARLHLDRHGKSPINDAAENHHLECLNVLVAAGAAGADKQLASYKAVHSCACTPGEARCALPNCINANGSRSPFYLHAPERERRSSVQERRGSLPSTVGSISSARSGPADGLYVNPMQRGTSASVTHHSSSGEDSSACSASDADTGNPSGWFLHGNQPSSAGAPAALYQRVRDLFHTRSPGPRVPAEGQEAPTMTVKAEVHGSTEVAHEHSDSDSGAEATRRDHHYEDIYMPREEQRQRRRSSSRDSGSHSRPGSAALVVDYTAKDNSNENPIKAYEEVTPAQEPQGKSTIATKLAALTHKAQNFASRLSSAAGSRRASVSEDPVVVASNSSGVSSGGSSGDEAPPPPPPPPAPPAPPPPVVLEEPVVRPSEFRGRLGRRGSAASADDERPRPNLVNKQPALPFVPPAFPHNAPDRLIKPSEYLKTITAPCKRDDAAAEARPPPPPPVPDNVPPPPPQPPLSHQPLAAISSAELSAVRLRTPATKTMSAPPPARSVSLQCLPSAAENYRSAKTDLIEELKMSKDITGIKKLKVERARRESLQDKETFTEFTKRFTAENFVDQGCPQVPERDASGNVIPAWKRQMLARRAAEKARRDLERELAGEAERRRAAAVPAWKRQLLQRREEAENRLRQSLYTPKVEDPNVTPLNGEWRAYPSGAQRAVSIDNITLCYDTPAQPTRAPSEAKLTSDHCNGHSTPNGKHEEEDESAKIIPWRAQLRKTNSKLNLLE
ncbi:espin isoform X2 [Pectinophora gossypiella]|uniref:espin isoform X2 n=1 Tax=Pectinophora gossypiella TaxID=13191 RepID=UPI00214E5897|nr:espin isoform X2 [Pectinophora gossypiella]